MTTPSSTIIAGFFSIRFPYSGTFIVQMDLRLSICANPVLDLSAPQTETGEDGLATLLIANVPLPRALSWYYTGQDIP
jgi:hypothetical protein